MATKTERAAEKNAGMYLYYLDCLLNLDREKGSSSEAHLLLKTHPDFVVGIYTRDTNTEIILVDAEFTRSVLLKKRAA